MLHDSPLSIIHILLSKHLERVAGDVTMNIVLGKVNLKIDCFRYKTWAIFSESQVSFNCI